MAMKVLYSGGFRDSLSLLKETDFTNQNFPQTSPATNNTLSSATPDGVLAGHFAVITGDNEVGIALDARVTSDAVLKGMFVLDSATDPFENQPALGSGKVAVLEGPAVVQVDVYESHSAAAAVQTYAAGDALYVGLNGMLTKVLADAAGGLTAAVGVVRVAPVSGSTTMTVELF